MIENPQKPMTNAECQLIVSHLRSQDQAIEKLDKKVDVLVGGHIKIKRDCFWLGGITAAVISIIGFAIRFIA
jgi:hypothetical protein